MAAYSSYAYRGKPHEVDERNNNTIYYDDGVCRTVIVDPDGRKRTAIGCSPFHESADSYVVQSEITEHVYSPHLTEYRHSSPKKKVEYGGHEKWRRPSSPDHPPELDDFFNGIQIEASRPHHKPSGGAATNWRPNPNPHSNGYGGGYNNNNKPTTGNYPIRNDNYDDYYRKESPTREWDRPVNHATRPVKISSPGRDAKLGLPTNSIEEAIHYLKGANAKISPVTGNQTHAGRPDGSPRVYEEVDEGPPRRYYDQNDHQYQAPSPWPRSSSPPTLHRRGHRTTGVIDSNEAAKRFGGRIVRI